MQNRGWGTLIRSQASRSDPRCPLQLLMTVADQGIKDNVGVEHRLRQIDELLPWVYITRQPVLGAAT